MGEEKRKVTPRRGEIWMVNFDPAQGSEIRKTRPALILQNDIANRYSPVTIVAAITSNVAEPLYPTEVLIEAGEGGLRIRSAALLNQIRSIDTRRLMKRLGVVHIETIERVNRALEISLGIVEI